MKLRKRGSSNLRYVVSGLLVGAFLAPAVQAETLRVCADPENMPFTSEKGSDQGMYVELAKLIAKNLNMDLKYHWRLTYNQRRSMRKSIAADKCDVFVGVPGEKDYRIGRSGLEKTTPFVKLTYAAVSAPSFKLTDVKDFDKARIGVLFGTPPHVMLSDGEKYDLATHRNNDAMFQALENNELDFFITWEPIAGYTNIKSHNGKWKITPLTSIDVESEMVVAVRKDKNLTERINSALKNVESETAALVKSYGFKSDVAPINIDSLSIRRQSAAARPEVEEDEGPKDELGLVHMKVADNSETAPSEKKEEAAAGGKMSVEEMAKLGRVRFNDVCSHCHSTDGASPVKRQNLQLLKKRYNDDWVETVNKIIREGLPDYGMPTWEGVLEDHQIDEILEFLKTVQK